MLWAIPATQVAHYAAVTLGLVVLLWLCGQVRGRRTLLIVLAAGIMLVLTHTRTALVGVVTGILVAGLSLIVAKARVRRFLVAASVVVLDRGADAVQRHHDLAGPRRGHQQLTDLTGRTKVWGPAAGLPRHKVPGDPRFRPVQ